MEETKI